MKNYTWILWLPFLCASSLGYGQQQESFNDTWFLLLNHAELSPKWSVGNEFHLRRTDWGRTNEQLLIRPFVSYTPKNGLILTGGYSYIRSYPYQPNAPDVSKPEYNIWEQVMLKRSLGKSSLSHRFRLEQRFQGQLELTQEDTYEVGGFEFGHRFRYRFTYKYDFSKKIFLHAFDELWIATNNKFQYANYDRNWLYIGLGYRLIPKANIQLAYLHQNIRKNTNLYELHPTVQLTFVYDFSFAKSVQTDTK